MRCASILAEPPRLHQCKAADDVTGVSDESFRFQEMQDLESNLIHEATVLKMTSIIESGLRDYVFTGSLVIR